MWYGGRGALAAIGCGQEGSIARPYWNLIGGFIFAGHFRRSSCENTGTRFLHGGGGGSPARRARRTIRWGGRTGGRVGGGPPALTGTAAGAAAGSPARRSAHTTVIRERRQTGVGTNVGPEGPLPTPWVRLRSRKLPYLTHILSCRCSLLSGNGAARQEAQRRAPRHPIWSYAQRCALGGKEAHAPPFTGVADTACCPRFLKTENCQIRTRPPTSVRRTIYRAMILGSQNVHLSLICATESGVEMRSAEDHLNRHSA